MKKQPKLVKKIKKYLAKDNAWDVYESLTWIINELDSKVKILIKNTK